MNCKNLAILTQFGWVCKKAKIKNTLTDLPEPQRIKTSKLPESLINLMISYELVTNKKDTAWFITNDILRAPQNENSFSWNEFEKESLKAAMSQDEATKVNDFWSNHFCFIMSVKSGYMHISIIIRGDKKGQIVWGGEPEYEDTIILAQSYDEFCSILVEHITGVKINEILNIIL
ncbi:hypothetical protein [Hafnia paralvei]|uniref:hypothetical protein n=1 Tax=Hafnia paralvei TaxID=546367 RepID=UPI0010348361|nr:hypothetical protein [Hafnia paralvei]TBM24738.1 hypothetical protein EYY85_14290 [Hafnia paralvei]